VDVSAWLFCGKSSRVKSQDPRNSKGPRKDLTLMSQEKQSSRLSAKRIPPHKMQEKRAKRRYFMLRTKTSSFYGTILRVWSAQIGSSMNGILAVRPASWDAKSLSRGHFQRIDEATFGTQSEHARHSSPANSQAKPRNLSKKPRHFQASPAIIHAGDWLSEGPGLVYTDAMENKGGSRMLRYLAGLIMFLGACTTDPAMQSQDKPLAANEDKGPHG
jgi:hypothetical protein